MTFHDLCLAAPLYEDFGFGDWQTLLSLEYFNGPLDAYCQECQQASIFHGWQGHCPKEDATIGELLQNPGASTSIAYIPIKNKYVTLVNDSDLVAPH